eukprot:NODE_263_length_11363_cov_0.749556.p5 type:complete len:242 gc:universal NODE_263_length_11363_cov_0.749556:6899-7624(+)
MHQPIQKYHLSTPKYITAHQYVLQYDPSTGNFTSKHPSNLFYGKLDPFPISLIEFNVGGNFLSGDVSNITFYQVQPDAVSALTSIQLHENQFTGYLPLFPPNLDTLALHGNRFSGSWVSIPESVTVLFLYGLPLTGSIYLKHPLNVLIQDTLIHNLTIEDTSQMADCRFSNTPMLNNLNVQKLYPICEHLNLFNYTAPIYGTIEPYKTVFKPEIAIDSDTAMGFSELTRETSQFVTTSYHG